MLDISEDATPEEIKKRYRHLSLCEYPIAVPSKPRQGSGSWNIAPLTDDVYPVIHPDKTSHARAPEAFDLLKKVRMTPPSSRFPLVLSLRDSVLRSVSVTHAVYAHNRVHRQAESELSDKAKRDELDAVIHQARAVLLKSHNLPPNTPDDDPRVKALTPPWKQQFLAKAKEMLIDEEVRRRKYAHTSPRRLSVARDSSSFCRAVKMNLANEGLEARKKEEEVNAKKRKAEEEARWEGPLSILVDPL